MARERNEFRITIRPRTGQGYPVLVSAPIAFGEPTGVLRLDPNAPEIRDKLSRIAEDRASDQVFQELGALLFERLLPGQLATSFELNWKQTEGRGTNVGLRVTLRILTDELRRLPWEVLYHPVHRLWLCTSPRCPLGRYVDALESESLTVRLPLRVLICVAEPRDLPHAGAGVEVPAVTGAFERLTANGIVRVSLLRHTQREHLHKTLKDFRPNVFHFIGHGSERGRVSGLFLERGDGSSEFLAADLLREILERPGTIRAAVLNACESDGIAYALARQGMAAVGMQYPIRSEAAVHFCRSLYEALASGMPFDAAVNAGRFSVRLECGADRKDWCVPVVFLPGGSADLFRIQKPVLAIQVASAPSGADVLLDGRNTGRRTPNTLVIGDDNKHVIAVRKPGFDDPVPQEVAGPAGRAPGRLDFRLKPKTGYLVVETPSPGVHVEICSADGRDRRVLGATDQARILGPVPLAVGTYRVEATHQLRDASGTLRLVRAVEVVTVKQGVTAKAVLSLPESQVPGQPLGPPPAQPAVQQPVETPVGAPPHAATVPMRGRLKKPLAIAGAALTAVCLVVAVIVLSLGGPDAGQQSQGMVLVPPGTLHKGAWDDSTMANLIRKYGLARASILVELLKTPARVVTVNSFYIDEYEVTNVEYGKFLKEVGTGRTFSHSEEPANKDRTPAFWSDAKYNQSDQPVVGVDWFDAYAYARWAGKRLPTRDEWELAASFPDRRPYPWGKEYSARSYEGQSGPQSVRRLPSVGRGRPVGMGGNVSEWTATCPGVRGMMTVRGGAWNRSPGDICALTIFRFFATRGVRNAGVGVRCVKDASSGPEPSGMIKIEGGRVRLGGENTPLLDLMRKYSATIKNLDETFLGPRPLAVQMGSFRIDAAEVTNLQYRKFLEHVRRNGDRDVRHPDQPQGKDHTPKYWDDPQYNSDNQPVVGADWFDAYAYARWAGKRLPTGDEWEYAARGKTKCLYPWGDTFSASRCRCRESATSAPAPVKSFPDGRSPFGVHDMTGNVMEWTADDFDAKPDTKTLRGGAWTTRCELHGIIFMRSLGARRTHRDNDVGFRCVSQALE